MFGIAVNPSGQPREGDPDWSEGNINDAVTSFVAEYPDRLIGFSAVHPFDPNCMDELERCRADLKMRGVKLGANYQNYDPLEPRALAVYDYAHPLVVDEIAMRYPDLRVVMAHLGHPWQVDTCVVIRKHPNVYADLSANFYRPFSFWEQLVKASEWNVLDKILFGTDWPVTDVAETIESLRRVDAIEAIIERDSLTLLGIADA